MSAADLCELITVLCLGFEMLHSSLACHTWYIFQTGDIIRIRWPVISSNEFRAVGSNPVLSQLCRVSRCVQAHRRHGFCRCLFCCKGNMWWLFYAQL